MPLDAEHMLRPRFGGTSDDEDALSISSDGHGASEMDPLNPHNTSQLDHDSGGDELAPSTAPFYDRRKMVLLSKRFPRAHAFLRKAGVYIRGPSPPQTLQPTPLLDRTYSFRNLNISVNLESRWLRLTRRFNRLPLLVILAILYIISLSFLVRANWYLVPADAFTGCTAAFWAAKDGCGLDGQDCQPFNSSTPIDFRCPASCTSTKLLNIRTVGDQQVIYEPLVVGGGDDLRTYRGDSWVCAAAIQVGAISNSKGGCAAVQLIGEFTSFIGTSANGVSSISFPSQFPLSFRITPSSSLTHCSDLRSPALAFNILITCLLFLILRPKPLILFWCLVCIGFWHITFFSDPRAEPPPISDAFQFFLPTLFIAYAFWLHAFRHVMPAFDAAPIERTVWYLLPFWLGVQWNVLEDLIPVDRLVGSDLRRPGAVTAVVVIGLLLLAIIINQIRVIRKTGWLPRYLAYYITGGLVLLVLAFLPGLTLRLHHYFFAILLMAGTAFPTRLSAVYQAFLLGLFLDGASRWGFDSILQTADELRRDAPLGSSLPKFLTTSSNPLPDIASTLSWAPPNATDGEGWDGFSLLVDDVERYAGSALNFSLAALNLAASVPHYFRLAYQKNGVSGDFSQAAIFYPNHTFVDPLPGPS